MYSLNGNNFGIHAAQYGGMAQHGESIFIWRAMEGHTKTWHMRHEWRIVCEKVTRGNMHTLQHIWLDHPYVYLVLLILALDYECEKILTCRYNMLCRICGVQIQPRRHVLDHHADYTAPTRQHELQQQQIIQIRNISASKDLDHVVQIGDLFEVWKYVRCWLDARCRM